MSRTEEFALLSRGAPSVGELIRALQKFPKDAEVMASFRGTGDVPFTIVAVADNADWGNDNELAIIEIAKLPRPAPVGGGA